MGIQSLGHPQTATPSIFESHLLQKPLQLVPTHLGPLSNEPRHTRPHTFTMPRLPAPQILSAARTSPRRLPPASSRLFVSTDAQEKGTQNSRPGWGGRSGDDHAVERDRHDVQGDASQEGMKKFQEGKDQDTKTSSGGAISRKDERNSNEKAKEEHPEAPTPVIGMNSERGSKGH